MLVAVDAEELGVDEVVAEEVPHLVVILPFTATVLSIPQI